MRTIPGDALTLLASMTAVEPVNILGIEWVAGQPTWYADKAIDDIPGKILEIGEIEDMQRSDSSGTTGALSVKLDDIDGSLKSIFDNQDIHLVKVNVWQSFLSLGSGSKFLVLSGQISTPIIWDEGTRTLSFEIVTKLEAQEIGWEASMGNFTLVDQTLIGQPWPMVFGTVQHSPGLQLQAIPTAFTVEPFGIIDPTIAQELVNLQNLLDQAILATLYFSQLAVDNGVDPLNDSETQTYVQMQADIQNQIHSLQMTELGQAAFARGSVDLVPTVNVTFPFSGKMRVGNNIFMGTLNNFSGVMQCQPVLVAGSFALPGTKVGQQFYNAGTSVVIADNYPIEFVASIVPGTVLRVWAMRSFNGLKTLAVVPPSYYTTSTKNYGGQDALIVTLKQPLSTTAFYADLYTDTWENNFGQYLPPHIVNHIEWDDQIYITVQSDIGPNPVDIMIYLIETYSVLSYDTTTFNAVKAALANYSMNFTLSVMQNVIQTLTDIAYQAECVIFLRDDVFYLIYLGQQPTPVDTLTEDDIVVSSLEVTTTPTENLITKYTATYRPDYSPLFNKPVSVILRYNIKKYGTHAETFDYYAYNNFYQVEHVATFWMIRRANTFKILKAKLLITKLNLEVFDAVTLNFATPYVANQDVVGLITSAKYNSTDSSIDVEIWTPVRLGEMAPYTFAWPAGLTETDIFPTVHDVEAGASAGTSGGQQLPSSNPGRNPIGVIDALGQSEQGLNGRLNWTSGAPLLGDDFLEVPIADPTEQSERFTPVPQTAPTGDYQYPANPDPTIPKIANSVPVRVLEYVGPDPKIPNVIDYRCESYENGIRQKPVITIYGQLQIDPNDRIPPGTWTLGCIIQSTTKDDSGHTTTTTDRAIQVPIWLT